MTGERIHQYTVVRKLGEGGMGSVWEAFDERLGRRVALKLLRRNRDATHLARFALEARAVSSLNHPGIVIIHDVLEHNGQPCLVMEFVDGRTLDSVIPPGGLPVPELIRVAIQIADTLAAAHKTGVIHRDIKPGNIMVTADGRVKVLDFGLVKMPAPIANAAGETQTLAGPSTAEGTILGTVNYMSPEQAQAKSVDARSDVFSLGAVLYEMATGKRAFEGETTISTITAILRDDPKPVSGEVRGLPRELERVITRCLRKEPDRRFQTALDVRNALEEVQEEWRSPSGTLTTPTLPPARGKYLWIAAALALTALAGAAMWTVKGVREKPADIAESIVVRPLGSLPGMKTIPSFSPDGNTVVMAWDGGDPRKHTNIYAMLLDGGRPLQLTSASQLEFAPFYSPDGRRVFFSRRFDNDFVSYSVPALGGEETRIADGVIQDVTSDGQWAIVSRGGSDPFTALTHYVVSLANGQERLLAPPGHDDSRMRCSADDRWVYFTRVQSAAPMLMRIPFEGGAAEPARFPALDRLATRLSQAWFAKRSGDILVSGLSKADGRERLFLVRNNGSDAVMLPANIPAGNLSPDGRRLAAVAFYTTTPLYRAPAFPARQDKLEEMKALDTPRGEGEWTPRFSPDGMRVAVSSSRRKTSQIWIWDARFTAGNPVFDGGNNTAASPAWSPDGQWIAFDARMNGSVADIWIVSASGGAPKQLTNDPAEDIVPCFDPAGQWVYFTSSRAGDLQIFKMARTGGPATQVTRGGGFTCRFSADGKFMYYLRSRNKGGIWRLDLAAGKEEQVAPDFQSRNWALLPEGLYMLDTGVPTGATARTGEAKFYRFSTRRVEKLGFVTSRPISAGGIDVSPDGKSVLYSQVESRTSDLMLVENLPTR